MTSSPRDNNGIVGLIAKSSSDNTVVVVEADPTTKRLKVDATITTGLTAHAAVTDGEVVAGANVGILILGTDGTNYQLLSTDTLGKLNVNTAITGFATEVGNLASVKTNTDKIPAQGQALAAASTPVVLTAAQISTLTPPAAITNFANETGGNLASIKAKTDNIPAQGQALAAASTPVVLTAAQVTTLTPPAAITGFATSAKQDTVDTSINTLLKPASTLAAVTTVTTLTGTTTLTPGTAAANLGKEEDAAHTSGDVGVFALGVRNDTLATGSGTTGDYTQISTDLKGRVMVGSAPRDLKGDQTTTITASTTETTIVTAIASTFIDIYGVILANTGSTATSVTIRDVTAGTSKGQLYVPAGDVRGFMLPIDAAWKQTTVNTSWTAQCSASTSSLVVTVFYIKNV